MNANVFVLVLVSAAFMAVWNGDQNHNNQVIAARARARAALVADARERHSGIQQVHRPETASRTQTVQTENSLAEQSSIPLPTNLAPGTWRAVSDRGDSLLITIESSGNSVQCGTLEQRSGLLTGDSPTCITTHANNRHWCFFRQQPAVQQATRNHQASDSAIE